MSANDHLISNLYYAASDTRNSSPTEAAARLDISEEESHPPEGLLEALDAVAARPERARLAKWVVGLSDVEVRRVMQALRGTPLHAGFKRAIRAVEASKREGKGAVDQDGG